MEFQQIGRKLQVRLENASTDDVLSGSNVLTAFFFSLASNTKLDPVSAVVPTGDIVLFGHAGRHGVVGGEWAYNNLLSGAPDSAVEGGSIVALGFFERRNRFPGKHLKSPAGSTDIDFGITSRGDNPTTGEPFVTVDNALIQNEVVFTFKGLLKRDVLEANSITNVSFLCGMTLVLDHNSPENLVL